MPVCWRPASGWPLGSTIERVLSRYSVADRDWILAELEQYFRRRGDLEVLREIKAYRSRPKPLDET
jgi:hypothetical protein